ncbi:MAG: glutamate-5-semialdehyde dehydrogenase [Pseudomonadota bacterium]
MDMHASAAAAGAAAIQLAAVKTAEKNRALEKIAKALEGNRARILEANRSDLERAAKARLAPPLLKRLKFDEAKITEAIDGIRALIALPDPIGATLSATEIDKGLELYKVTCPIGVIGVIFESRPDALVQISALCLKSGNAVMLKGGSEAAETNRVLAEVITEASLASGLPSGWLALMETRDDVADMLRLDQHIDLIIPRGSNEFVKHIMDNTTIPVLGHADGICHVYVDRAADLDMAVRVVVDSKCQYVAVCNAAETLLVHRAVAAEFLPAVAHALKTKGVELRGCTATRDIIDAAPADETDWQTEYLDLILSIRVVDSMAEAVDHINRYGSGHTDVIVTKDRTRGIRFMETVDTANAFLNCSSRFADGFRFGLGAEVGISTNKIHARGPVGMEGLVIYQWRMIGEGHVVADYAGEGARRFTHRKLDKSFKG